MNRVIGITIIGIIVAVGCSARAPVTPDINSPALEPPLEAQGIHDERYRLWGEWSFYFDETHTEVDVVPKRQASFHLNGLKFLEEYCTDCLEITSIENNGDGTIDLSVLITHPFPGNPEYTGFDVKGIIMFNGSHTVHWWSQLIFPYGTTGNHNYFYISWAELGDPEVLNQDGYTVRWSPWWDSGSEMPIFSYWEGKYSNGTPTANINAYINYYTDEERHMFRVDQAVSRTYHISLPPGAIVAGYAVEACWEPPIVTPVTDPANDFPITANQEEPYYFRFVVNEDEPITEDPLTFDYPYDCSATRYEWRQWHGHTPQKGRESWPYYPGWGTVQQSVTWPCDQEPPPGMETRFTSTNYYLYEAYGGVNGNYRGVAIVYDFGLDFVPYYVAYDVFDFTLDYD